MPKLRKSFLSCHDLFGGRSPPPVAHRNEPVHRRSPIIRISTVAVQFMKIVKDQLDIIKRIGRPGCRITAKSANGQIREDRFGQGRLFSSSCWMASEILMSLSNSTLRSSLILASSSAMGCSKSRNFKSMAPYKIDGLCL